MAKVCCIIIAFIIIFVALGADTAPTAKPPKSIFTISGFASLPDSFYCVKFNPAQAIIHKITGDKVSITVEKFTTGYIGWDPILRAVKPDIAYPVKSIGYAMIYKSIHPTSYFNPKFRTLFDDFEVGAKVGKAEGEIVNNIEYARQNKYASDYNLDLHYNSLRTGQVLLSLLGIEGQMSLFVFAMVMSILIEFLVLIALFRLVTGIKLKGKLMLLFGTCAGATISTIIFVWWVFPLLLYLLPLLFAAEAFAVIVEACIYALLLKIPMKKAFILSFACNLASYLIGVFILV